MISRRFFGALLAMSAVPCAALPLAAGAQALPFLPAGDARLRHELQLAVDDGRVPLGSTWPIPSFDVPADERDALRSHEQPGTSADAGWFANGAAKPTRVRSFTDTPRENGELGVQAGWAAGDYAGGVFRLAYAFDPEDGMHYRFDDSYLAWRIGNWWLTAGLQERWWGPGHDGSLILSNNARPMPQLAIERASAKAPVWRWLKWVGPYRWSSFMGRMEDRRVDFPHPYVWGLRFTMRPFDSGLELGFSRTAQWCRPGVCGFSAFKDVVLGRDNRGENVAANQEPGNQLAGYDLRYRVPRTNFAIYYQGNGESIDNGNWRPRILTQLVGAELWSGSSAGGASWRTFVEFAGTTCGEWGSGRPAGAGFGCAYENGLFTGGYRFRGRVMGHSVDRDAQLYTLGGLYIDTAGRSWEVRVRKGTLNRGSVATPTYAGPVVESDLTNAEAKVDGTWKGFTYSVGVGIDRLEPVNGDRTTSGRAFVSISAPWAP